MSTLNETTTAVAASIPPHATHSYLFTTLTQVTGNIVHKLNGVTNALYTNKLPRNNCRRNPPLLDSWAKNRHLRPPRQLLTQAHT